jgi:DNA-binding MarR family transcriptional regulator
MSKEVKADFGILLNLAFHSFKTALEISLAEAGFDDVGVSFGYVFRLLADSPLSLREVAERLKITPQGASKIVNEMVKKDYVTRGEDPLDKRIVRFMLTKRALKALESARRFHELFEAEIAQRMGAARAATTRRVLEDIIEQSGGLGAETARPA